MSLCHDIDPYESVRLSVIKGDLVNVKRLVEKFQLTSDGIRSHDNCGLHFAAEHGYTDVVKFLFDGLTPGLTSDDARLFGNHALFTAVEGGHLAIVKFLVNEVGLVDDARSNSTFLLCLAADLGRLEVIKFLINEVGLSPDRYVVQAANFKHHREIVMFLGGADSV